EDAERLLEPAPRVLERRSHGGLEGGLPAIAHRPLSELASERVVGEPLDLLGKPIRVERLDGLDDPCMELAATLLQKPAVCDLVRECVLEGVLQIRIEPGLVQELGGLQMIQTATQRLLGQLRDRLEQREWHVLADDGGDLQETFVLRMEPVDACREYRL